MTQVPNGSETEIRKLTLEACKGFPSGLQITDFNVTKSGAAFWSFGVDNYFSGVGTTLKDEFASYNHVVYLESAGEIDYLQQQALSWKT